MKVYMHYIIYNLSPTTPLMWIGCSKLGITPNEGKGKSSSFYATLSSCVVQMIFVEFKTSQGYSVVSGVPLNQNVFQKG
jgi:hypothetical protein